LQAVTAGHIYEWYVPPVGPGYWLDMPPTAWAMLNYGIADFLKPFAHYIDETAPVSVVSPHAQLYIDDTTPTPGKIGVGGSISGNWSDASDLAVSLENPAGNPKVYDFIVITTTERVRLDWGIGNYDTLDCSANFRLLDESQTIVLNERIDTLHFRLHKTGDTAPEVTITAWKIVPPSEEE
jgi:hypothetical protein